MNLAPLILAAALSATAAKTGQMSPTSDLSGNRVRVTGGSASRPLKDRFELTPLDFAAAGDGITDDTIAVQTALDSGKPVFCPGGYTFAVSGVTMSTAGQRFYGACKLKLADASNAPVLILSEGVTVDGVRIDGNKANQSTSDEILGSAVYITSTAQSGAIVNTYIHDAKRSGIVGYGYSSDWRIEGNRIDDVGFIAVRPSTGSGYTASGWVIAQNRIARPGQDGIGTVAIQSATIANNRILLPTVSGIALEARCDYTTVSGNTVIGDTTHVASDGKCVQVNDATGVTVTGNTCKSLAGGVVVAGGTTSGHVTISNNVFDDTPYSWTGAIEFDGSQVTTTLLAAYCYHGTVSGNTIRNSPHAGIMLNAVSCVTVQGNTIHNWDVVNDVTVSRNMAGIVMRSYAHDNIVQGNILTNDTPAWYRVGILEVVDGGQSPLRNRYLDNEISGVEQDVLVQRHGFYQSEVRRRHTSSSAPAAFTWLGGQKVDRPAPTPGQSLGWMVAYANAGSFGTAPTTHGSGNKNSTQLTISDSQAWLHSGMMVSVAGAGTGGAALPASVVQTDRVNNVMTLDAQIVTTVSGAAVTLLAPTFTDLPRVAPAAIRYTKTIDVGSIAANTCTPDATIDMTISDGGTALADANCLPGLPTGFPEGLTASCRVTSTAHVDLRLCNVTGSPIDPPSRTYTALVFNP